MAINTNTPQYSEFIHKSRYARWKDKEGRRETWEETISRYLDFFKGKYPEVLTEDVYKEIYNSIQAMEVMPSMRCLMSAGKALERDNMAGFNCSYLAIDHPRSFDEMMYILMCGTGAGFSVERQYVSKLPEVAEEFHLTDSEIKVSDSKIGWSSAFRELISLLYAGKIPKWDMSKVRPAGAKLKTFGGRASGPEPLNDLFVFSVNLFKGATGRKLTSVECHDLCCKVAEIVVVGGVRRSALISLSNMTDDRMRRAKSGQWWVDNPQRALANNSACYTEKPDFESFLKEWTSLHESKSGERGMFSRVASQKQAAKNGRRDATRDFGTNPCCFTGDMKLRVVDCGKVKDLPFSDLSGKSVSIVNLNGEVTEGSVWSSGMKDTVYVNFYNKDPIHCTPDHVFMTSEGEEVEAQHLKSKRVMPYFNVKSPKLGDDFLAGFMLGDAALSRLNSDKHLGLEVFFSDKDLEIANAYGAELKGTNRWYSHKAREVAMQFDLPAEIIGKRGLPPTVITLEGISGLYSANGCVIKAGRVTLKTVDRLQAGKVKEFLTSCGLSPYITVNKEKINAFTNGDYKCKESYDVNLGKYLDIVWFAENISFAQEYKRVALRELILSKAPVVMSVVKGGVEEVFDFTEPETHWGVVEGVIVHNSEIILRPNQVCNLSEVVARSEDTSVDLKRKVRLAAILGTLQSTLTDFRYLRKIWKSNTEEEALLGVSLTGIMDHPVLNGRCATDLTKFFGHDKWSEQSHLEDLLRDLKQVAIDTNKEWAEKLGVSQSVAITCVKPSGTVSQLTDSASGIHPRFSPFYIRRVRADEKDPLTQMLESQGFPCEVDHLSSKVRIFSFPIAAPDNAVCTEDVGAMEQLRLWKIYQDHWCEHKPSITVYYKDSEFLEVGQWVYNNFDDVSGISFLPYSGHTYQQAPYEPIDEETFNRLSKELPVIDWNTLEDFEKEDTTTGNQELACSGSICEIVDLTK